LQLSTTVRQGYISERLEVPPGRFTTPANSREGAINTKQSEDYDNFYLEIPHVVDVDPLTELSTEVEDLSTPPVYDSRRGLSQEQVTQIARDALQDARREQEEGADEPTLFGDDSPASE
jgi:hypothetical protein